MNPQEQFDMLLDGLRLLAAAPDEQVRALPEFVCVTDEVLNNFSDAYLLVGQLRRAGLVDDQAAVALKRLDDHLERLPSDPTLAETASLSTHPFWAEARALASSALSAMGESTRPPVLRRTRYLKA